MKILYIVPDLYEKRPKPCMNGWGSIFITVAPDGAVLPCQSARVLPNIPFPNVLEHDLDWIWYKSDAFNHFRGQSWMKEPCRSCPECFTDFGGGRCQAYLFTGDMHAADPVCDLTPHHQIIVDLLEETQHMKPHISDLTFRNTKNSKLISLQVIRKS